MKINSSLPIKYHLNLHMMGEKPCEDGLIFEIIKYLINQLSKKDNFDYSNIKFTSKTLKYVFGDKMSNDVFKSHIIEILKNNISKGNIETKNKNMYIKDILLTKFYT
jgi:hypothetical protein